MTSKHDDKSRSPDSTMSYRHTILFITDSLGFPRAEPELVRYEQTYIALLKREFADCDFIHQGYGGATIRELYNRTSYFHGTVHADLVFMQSGIVDCAPRALKVVEQQIVSRLPILGSLAVSLVKRYSVQLRRLRKLTYTPIAVFAEYTKRFEQLFSKVYWIGILPASAAYDARIAGIGHNVTRYNAVFAERRLVDTSGFDEADIMSDYHHLSAAGHRRLATALAQVIRIELYRVAAGGELAGAAAAPCNMHDVN